MNNQVEGIILAGGKSSRMRENKSLVLLDKKPLIEHVFNRMKKQVNKLSINSNEFLSIFPQSLQFGDAIPGQLGPLSGIFSGLVKAKSDWVQFCPNDTPFFPTNLVEQLSRHIDKKNPKIILPISDNKLEPIFLLCPKYLASNCEEFLSSGERKVEAWIKSNNFQTVDFEEKDAFFNINSIADLEKI